MRGLYSGAIFGSSLYVILWFFVIFSFIGVLVEGLFCLVTDGVLELRLGLLYLPLRPVYGFGGVAYAVFLDRFIAEPVVVFLLGALLASVVEYVASFATERTFGAVSWNYSDKLLNLQGRICLQYSVGWGLLALLALYVLDPLVYNLVGSAGDQVGSIVLTLLILSALLSSAVTLAALARVRHRVDVLEAQAEGRAVSASDTRWDQIIDRLVPDRVIIHSFPRMTLVAELKARTGQQQAPVRPPERVSQVGEE
jgi:uncharacterized membrane protein